MTDDETLRQETRLLDVRAPSIQALIDRRGWRDLPVPDRIGAAYAFVRDEIALGYNSADDLPASAVLADGYGQCNTKAVLLMALLRGLGIPCRLHAATVWKSLQRGIVPELVYPLGPREILHSWVEVAHDGAWRGLEGVILDAAYLDGLRQALPGRDRLCGYAAGTACLTAPPVDWAGADTAIQASAIARDLGIFDTPDALYAGHRQDLGRVRAFLYRHVVRHWMNRRAAAMRRGRAAAIPGGVPDSPTEVAADCGRVQA
jgi:hypothetical protein